MWYESRPISILSGILIHPTVWPQYANVTDRKTGQIDRQRGQRSDSIGRTVLQTVAQKPGVQIGAMASIDDRTMQAAGVESGERLMFDLCVSEMRSHTARDSDQIFAFVFGSFSLFLPRDVYATQTQQATNMK